MSFAEVIDEKFKEMAIRNVANEVVEERFRQNEKWGEQNHPDGTGPQFTETSNEARAACDLAAEDGTLTWRHILVEEFYEALAEVDETKLRKELIQVSAVADAWVEAIDRRQKRRGV
jgi:hypothetical protein